MFRFVASALWAVFALAVVAVLAHVAGLDDLVREIARSGRLLDWGMGALCLVWLLVLLKAPWDLYFQAQAVAFEQERSRERGVALAPGREGYVRRLARRLGWLAVGLHVFSAALVAGAAWLTGGLVGYWFAGFYLVSTLLRPLVAGYAYLMGKLRAVGEEARYPRDDVREVRELLERQVAQSEAAAEELRHLRRELEAARDTLGTDAADLRARQEALSREFERTVSRLTDNQEVIQGIRAFVRLISQSAVTAE
jgi:hypothetical protein